MSQRDDGAAQTTTKENDAADAVPSEQEPQSADTAETVAEERNSAKFPSRCTNVIHQLVDRTVTGRRLPRPPAAHQNWSPWISLGVGATVTAMAWDHVGVLLAVATCDKIVSIWDWDAVRAARQASSAMEPVCTFSIPHTAKCLQWNDEDQVAVAFRGSSQVQVYNVAHAVDGRVLWITLKPPHKSGCAVAVQCLPRGHWLVSYRCGQVRLYKVVRSKATLQWMWRAQSHGEAFFTHVQPLSSTLLLAGYSCWVHLDWQHCTRKAFSTEKTPIVLDSWTTMHKADILTLQVQHESHCTWVTADGFVFAMNIHNRKPRMVHAPPKLRIQSFDGQKVINKSSSTGTYSQPLGALCACSSGNLLCWKSVSPVTHVLPHHDRRNVGGSIQVLRSPKQSLTMMDTYGRTIEMPLSEATSLSGLTLHPSDEWLVVAPEVGREVQVWHARKLPQQRIASTVALDN